MFTYDTSPQRPQAANRQKTMEVYANDKNVKEVSRKYYYIFEMWASISC